MLGKYVLRNQSGCSESSLHVLDEEHFEDQALKRKIFGCFFCIKKKRFSVKLSMLVFDGKVTETTTPAKREAGKLSPSPLTKLKID